MKKKKVIIVISVIIALLIIFGVVAAICLNQDTDSDSRKSNNGDNSSLEWGDVYLKILGDEENTEDIEEVKVQMADLNNDKVPECIIYGSRAGVRLYCKSI